MLRIGKIAFANLAPIYHTLEKECLPPHYSFTPGNPAEVNKLLREGSVDISPSSSIEYLRRRDRYTLIEDHSISSFGAIRSILLFSKLPINELGEKTVLASNQSETSTALLRIVMKKFYGENPNLLVSGLPLAEGFRHYPAFMLIGDDALRSRKLIEEITGSDVPVHIYDLGELWYRETGLPFVFALWIARKECCESEEFVRFVEALDDAKSYAAAHLETIAGSAEGIDYLTEHELVAYWRNISFDLGEEHKKGLELFRVFLEEEGQL